VQQAQAALDAGEAATASQIFARIVAQEPTNAKAQAGLIRSRVATGDIAGARALLKGLPAELSNKPEIVAAASAVELFEVIGNVGDLAALQKRLAADPADPQTKLDLALALFGRGRSEAAIDTLLEMIRADREWNDGAARQYLLKIFDALGSSNPLTTASRRRLSAMLFS
jgi:putative thioredoxin